MKEPSVLPIDDALRRLADFDTVIDARSPAEFALDRLPAAINAPVLDDAERARVGTLYRQSAFAARRLGAALVAHNIGTLLQTVFADKPREWSALVYCWRGGQRSGALATVLARVGWRISVLEGGYRAFRRVVLDELERRPAQLRWHVLAGRTGAGKSLILQQLQARGEQVLDLEAIARHRGSVLGVLPDHEQPSQKAFETAIWNVLRRFDAERPVYVESESRRVGRCHLPQALIDAMRSAPCTIIESPLEVRTALLLREYRHLVADRDLLFSRLDRLIELHGRERIASWKAQAQAEDWPGFVSALLRHHYDPSYDRSIGSNYAGSGNAARIELSAASDQALAATAQAIAQAGLNARCPPGAPDR